MATAQHPPNRFNSLDQLESSLADAEQKQASVDNLSERSPSANEEKLMTAVPSQDSNNTDFAGDAPHHLVSSDVVCNYNPIYPTTTFSPQAHSFFYGGYENSVGDREDHCPHVNVDSLDIGLTGVYVENPPPVYHTGGYGYNPQMPYGHYSSVMAPVPSIAGDGHLYPQQFQFPGTYYQQPAPPNLPHLSSSNHIPQADLSLSIDQQGAFPADASNFNSQPFGPRTDYRFYGHYGDVLMSAEGSGSGNSLLSATVSPQPMSAVMRFNRSTMPLSSGMDSQQSNSLYGFESSISPVDRGYSHNVLHHGSSFGSSFPILGSQGHGSTFIDKNRRRGKGSALLCGCNGMLDFLNEQNRGPRANKPKNQTTEHNYSLGNENDSSVVVGVDHKLYNSPDFVTEYKDATFFIIKSYTEDNVHKSIKYGVWASTSSGNRKLDSAYHEAKRKEDPCPVFLFFSVNASAQFLGVAEMIGPVDFEKSVDYWQQDKWSGQFPVKWHIVKDVPNNIFRHIILEYNDNKPVTNSRDAQEVKLEQGLEMLRLFKIHEYGVSIIDDFIFYEVREKAIQERKAQHRHHHHLLSNSPGFVPGASMDHQRNPTAVSNDYIDHISKSFADAVRLEERSSVDSTAHKSSSLITDNARKPDELKKPEATITSNYQGQQLQ